MSTKIGIVSEGISDFWALQHIIERYLKECDVYTIPLKPKVTPNGKQDGFGTWQGVFQYISGCDENKLIIEAKNEGCRFVVIQIDTDVCEEYGVKKDTTNIEIFFEQVKEQLSSHIHPEFDQSNIIYAICIHELECWLIPFVNSEAGKCSIIDGCLKTVNKAIKTKGSIDKDNKNDVRVRSLYQYIFTHKKKPKDIKDCAQYNKGFENFVKQLDQIKEILNAEDQATEEK
jgi:soluble cytochrome b562